MVSAWMDSVAPVGAPHVRDASVPELLAPAGGPEPFHAAVAAGADAIYCGLGNDFNARRNARNFDDDSFVEACRAAHLAGARVYVTVNIAIRSAEMASALALVRRATELGADAFIIQDWGLMRAIRRTWPQLEIHVSTQANVHDARGVAWCRDVFGAHRVTLSRELSLPEIERISHEGVELEVFGHGALCFCYSGVCLYSSFFGGRSANRGLCAQPCRLPHDLVDEDGHVLSAAGRTRPLCPKDDCTIDDLAELARAGAGALKVEGRMKAPEYVLEVTSAYRAALDDLALGVVPADNVAAGRRRALKRTFNRDFTDAYLRGTSGDEMMSYERSNNRGEICGEVVSGADGGRWRVDESGRRRGHEYTCQVRFDAPVGEGDLLELRDMSDPDGFVTCLAPRSAEAGDVVACTVARQMAAGSVVRALRSKAVLDAAGRVVGAEVPRRREVDVRIVARLGRPFAVRLTTADGLFSGEAEGGTVEAARTKAVTAEELVEHVGRMGQTPFCPRGFEVEMDNGVGMGFSSVHKVRAAACDALVAAILAPHEELAAGVAVEDGAAARAGDVRAAAGGAVEDGAAARAEVCAIVGSPEAAEAALGSGATRIYAAGDDLREGSWPEGVVPVLDEICREADHARIDPLVVAGKPVAVGNVSELALAVGVGAVPEVRGCIPVHNTECLRALEDAGAQGVWLSCELTLEEIGEIASAARVPVGVVVWGRPRLMTSEHCVLQVADACVGDCAACGLRRRRLSLTNVDGKHLPVRTDREGRSRIYDAFPLDATPETGELVARGVTRLAVDATLLSVEETEAAVAHALRALAAVRAGERPASRAQGATSGHLYQGIG